MIKIKWFSQLLFIGTLCTAISACGGGGSDGTSTTPTPTPTPTENTPPVLNVGVDQSIDEQSQVTLNATATDSDGSIVSYLWIQATGSTVTLSGADTAAPSFLAPTVLVQDGAQTLTFRALVTDDDGASATDTVVITVNPVNATPTVDAGNEQTVNEGSSVQLSATAADIDGTIDSIAWSQTSGTQIQLTDADTLTPSFNALNDPLRNKLTFELAVTDNEGEVAYSTVHVAVTPIITGLVVDDVLVGSTVQLLDVTNLTVIFETQTDQNGRYIIEQQASLPERYILSITGGLLNNEPFLGTLSSLCLSSERLSCHATPLSTLIKRYAERQDELNSGNKPQWVAFLSSELGFDLSTEPFINENHEVVPLDAIRAYLQNGEQMEQWLTTTLDYVQNDNPNEEVDSWFPSANLKPTVDAGVDQSADEQTQITLTGTANDADGSIAAYQWAQINGTTVSLSNATTATASFTSPIVAAVEDLTFSLTVTDNEGSTASDLLIVTVNPLNALPTADAGSDQTVDEQTSIFLTASASDTDGSITGYKWSQTDGTAVTLNKATSATASFTSPTLRQAQTLTFSVTVTDNEGGTASDTLNVTVNPVNTSPNVDAGSDQSVDEETTVTLAATVSDIDGTISSYQWTQTGGDTVTLSNPTTPTASFTSPALTTAKILTFRLSVTDDEGGNASDTVNVTVNPVNLLPTVNTSNDQSVSEQTQVTLSSTASDEDGNIASYQWTQTSGNTVTLSNATTQTASFTSPTLIEKVILTFTVTVTDNEGGTASDSIDVTVNPDNALPLVDAGNDQSVNEQSLITLAATATDSDGSIDSYLWTQTNGDTVSLNNATTATASFTSPTLTQATTLTFNITVTDNEGDTDSDTINVTVNPVNALPTVDAGIDQAVNEQTTVTVAATASDTDGSIISYQWVQTSGEAITLNNATTTTASFTTPTLTATATLAFTITVTDNEGGTNSDTVNVIVNPVNALPTVNADIDQTVDEQTTVTIAATASDTDGSIISYQWTQISGEAVTLNNAATKTANFTSPTLIETAVLTFNITATDNEAGTSSDTLNVTVNPVNAQPSVYAGIDQTVDEQTPVTLTALATDTDGSITTYLWTQTNGPTVTLNDETTATASFTSPTLINVDTLTFKLTVTDNEGDSADDSINVTVNPVNTAPVASAGDDQVVETGSTVELSGSQSTDIDGDTLAYSWTFSSVPTDSTASFSSTTQEQTTFVADKAGTYVVSLTVNDGAQTSNADNVNILAKKGNSAPTGTITISGMTNVDEVLTASNDLADANGLGTLNYQWQRTLNDIVSSIDAATSTTYTLTSADVGYTLSVNISYTDGDNFEESVTSEETTVISEAVSAGKPNILLIIADDQGLDASAQYALSSDLPTTPNINALAASGITFDNAWATPACTTTRGTLITGQHGINSGISFVPAVMDSSTQTLQRYLKSLSDSSDYQTAVVGKWHLGGGSPDLTHPTDSGVDYYAGTITGTLDDYYSWDLTTDGQTTTNTDYHTTKITDLAIDWLDTQNQANTPWFMWLAYVAPHSPFHLPPSGLHNRTDLTGTVEHIDANKRDYYLAAIEAMDSEIGRLIDSLPEKERDNTLIVYIGDNGTPSAVIDTAVYDRSHSKGSLFEGGIRIPMVVSGNGVSRANERETALVNTSDFYATFSNFTGSSTTQLNDSYSFLDLLSSTGSGLRNYNYSEFQSDDVTGWTVRDQEHKLIEFEDGTQALYKISEDINETTDLVADTTNADIITELDNQAANIRGETSSTPLDITNAILINRSANCADYVESYQSTVMDVNNSTIFNGALSISVVSGKCIFSTNNIPNHDFNDGDLAFPNDVAAQNISLEITASPAHATTATGLTLRTDNAVLLNGVKVDLLAAACFGVGDGKVGCNDINQPWRYDPMFSSNGFRVDTHNAHSQPDGSYHYHGTPNALFANDSNAVESPVIGFAADGYPIYGSYFDDSGTIRKALSSFQLISGSRPTGTSLPGGTYDGTYRDDYEYVENAGDLDECNGMTVNGVYGYYVTDGYPYILSCFKGTPDGTFDK